ncbi:MAG: 50S ribosomal protein L11 methyltransferase [Pseudonocardiales bacterium]|nr:50S ribosomal protein L11 methyltransferase [Pseudonocardiales bacterium]
MTYDLPTVNRLLHRLGWHDIIERGRANSLYSWNPWLDPTILHQVHCLDDQVRYLIALLHLGQDVPLAHLDTVVAESLESNGLIARDVTGDRWTPVWRLTSFRGIAGVARSGYGHSSANVYLGSDGLRFTDAVLAACPRGRVLDVGCGSGIASAAAAQTAQTVTAIDVVSDAAEATKLTGELNGVTETLSASAVDLEQFLIDSSVDTVIANLPGLPVPEHISYPVAGNGGPDGRVLIRSLWRKFAASLSKMSKRELIMRFESVGDEFAPAALQELQELFGTRCDVLVVTDAQLPLTIRHSMTAKNATALNPELTNDEILQQLHRGTDDAKNTHFYCATLKLRHPGEGTFQHIMTARRLNIDHRYQPAAFTAHSSERVLQDFLIGFRSIPDEFYSLGGLEEIDLLRDRLDDVRQALREGQTPREIGTELVATNRAAHESRVLTVALAVAVAAQTLVDAGDLAGCGSYQIGECSC